MKNHLYIGDTLHILRKHIKSLLTGWWFLSSLVNEKFSRSGAVHTFPAGGNEHNEKNSSFFKEEVSSKKVNEL